MKLINTRGRKLSGENVTERVCSFIIRVLLKFTMRSCKGFRCSSDSEDAWIRSSGGGGGGGGGGGIRLCLVACCCSEASWLTPQASIFSHSLSRLHRLKHLWTLRVWYLRWVTVWTSENSRTSLRTTTTTPPWSVGSTWDASAESTRLTPTSSRFHLDSVWFFHIKHLWREFNVSLITDEHQWRSLQGRRVLSAAIFCVWGHSGDPFYFYFTSNSFKWNLDSALFTPIFKEFGSEIFRCLFVLLQQSEDRKWRF